MLLPGSNEYQSADQKHLWHILLACCRHTSSTDADATLLVKRVMLSMLCCAVLQTEYNEALSGSMHEAQQTSTMSASLAKTNWINSGLRSQVHSDNTRLALLQYVSASLCNA